MGFLDSGGQGAQAFTDSFLKTYLGLNQDARAANQQKMMEQIHQMQLAQMQREQDAETYLANIQKPTTAQYFQDQPESMSGQPPQMTTLGQQRLQGMIGNAPRQNMESVTAPVPGQFETPSATDQLDKSQTPLMATTTNMVDNPAYTQGMNQLLAKGSEQVAANPSMQDYMKALYKPKDVVDAMMKMKGQEGKIPPLVLKLMDAAGNDKLGADGYAILEKLGYGGLFSPKENKEPTSRDAVLLKGRMTQLQNENPDWPVEKVQVTAAEQLKKEDQTFDLQKAREGRMVFATKATPTPGVYTHVNTDGTMTYFENNPDGTQRELTSKEVENRSLTYKEATPTARVKTMQQLAPKVYDLATSLRNKIIAEGDKIGPVGSRARNIWTNKIGGSDPAFAALSSEADLTATLLANMHVGASGAEKTIERFSDMLKVKNQSPKNLLSSLDVIMKYAEHGKNPTVKNIVDTDNILTDSFGEKKTNAPGSNMPAFDIKLKPGVVRKGYRFKGGDPTNQNNWEVQ